MHSIHLVVLYAAIFRFKFFKFVILIRKAFVWRRLHSHLWIEVVFRCVHGLWLIIEVIKRGHRRHLLLFLRISFVPHLLLKHLHPPLKCQTTLAFLTVPTFTSIHRQIWSIWSTEPCPGRDSTALIFKRLLPAPLHCLPFAIVSAKSSDGMLHLISLVATANLVLMTFVVLLYN